MDEVRGGVMGWGKVVVAGATQTLDRVRVTDKYLVFRAKLGFCGHF